MMEKTEAVNKLKKAGCQVQFDASVVTVLLEKNMNFTQEIKKLRAFFQEIGYDSSFGVKQVKDDNIQTKKNVTLVEEVKQEEVQEIKEENFEVGEQFSLEDFGIN